MGDFEPVGYCERCCKRSYMSRRAAKRIAKMHPSHKTVYECPTYDQLWHVGELHWTIIRGLNTRDTVKYYAKIRDAA